jgi:alpha-galactosidase
MVENPRKWAHLTMVFRLLLIIANFALFVTPLVSRDGTGRLPGMGWNSWNEYGCEINDMVFINVANKLISLGLKDLGYEYVNIDDCWSDKEKRRHPVTREIIPDFGKFPQGIRHTVQQIHALGLKIGIYSDAGSTHCNMATTPIPNSS